MQLVNNPFDWAYDLEDMGFTGWEIVNEGKQRLNEDTMRVVREIAESTMLELSVHISFSDLNLASVNEPIWRESLRQMLLCVDRAAEFTKILTLHPGYLSPLGGQMVDLAWNRNIEGITRISDRAEEYGMRVGLENMVNMPFIFGRTPSELTGMVDTVGRDNLGVTLDMGHANTNGLVSQFLEITDYVVHVHLHDNNGKRDEHLVLGQGTVPWGEVFEALRDYRGRLVIEARSLEEGKESLKYAQKLIIDG